VSRRLHVDGETFEVIERAEHPGAYELRLPAFFKV
jgi:hypothetical protein